MMKNFHYSFLYLCKLKKNTIVSKIKNCSYFIPITATCRKLHISFVTARYYCMFVDSPRALLPKNGKYFKEIENEYAHGVMLNSPAYSSSLLKYPLQIKSLNYEQSSECRSPFNNFAKATRDNISIGLDLESPEFSVIIKELVAELPLFSDKEIEDTLRYLCMWPPTSSTVTPNFKALWNELDRQCVKRMKNWNEAFPKYFSNMTNETKHMVFVYGTLKRGEPNHDLIEKRTEGKAVFVNKAQTVKKWPLVIASRYNIPYLLYCEGKGMYVVGEVYEIDDIMLSKMDELECHPDYYTRLKEEVYIISGDSKEIIKPWFYFLKNFRSELLDLPFLSEYSSRGSHGLEYVSRYNRPSGSSYYSDVMNL